MGAGPNLEGMAFTKEENEQLTRVGPGTLMGDLFRQSTTESFFARSSCSTKPPRT